MSTHGPARPIPWWAPGNDRHLHHHGRGTGIKCSVCLNEICIGWLLLPGSKQGRMWVGCPCLYLTEGDGMRVAYGKLRFVYGQRALATHWLEAHRQGLRSEVL